MRYHAGMLHHRWLTCVALAAALSGCTDDDVFDAVWYVRGVDANINPTRPDGSAWETDGTAPDPQARVNLNGVEIHRTGAMQNTLTPMWTEGSSGFDAERGKSLTIELFDKGTTGEQPIISGCAIALTDELAETQSGTCTSAAGSVSLFVFTFSE
jgi:hypothetical protein